MEIPDKLKVLSDGLKTQLDKIRGVKEVPYADFQKECWNCSKYDKYEHKHPDCNKCKRKHRFDEWEMAEAYKTPVDCPYYDDFSCTIQKASGLKDPSLGGTYTVRDCPRPAHPAECMVITFVKDNIKTLQKEQ
jgi:hypothetical protein